jgi:hypothetical protein
MLGRLAEALGSTTDYLIAGRGPDSEVKAFVPRLEGLPKELRGSVLEFLDLLMKVCEIILQRKPKKRKSSK